MPLAVGDVFAQYMIQRPLGAGVVSEVYLAKHPRLPRVEAIKVMRSGACGDRAKRAQFRRESDLLSTLLHPNLIAVHDLGEDEGRPWFSMDYVDGSDAGSLLAQRFRGGMPTDLVLKITTAIADALDYVHENGLVHCDVKPGNVMIANDDLQIFLVDFGFIGNSDELTWQGRITDTLGTVGYSAPELLDRQKFCGQADQYALAATVYHLLSGSQLFAHPNRAVVLGRHRRDRPPRLADTQPALTDVDPVLATALAKDPSDRFPDCASFARALTLALA